MNAYSHLPLVYSCSGASTAAQMANHLAVKLDRLREAEMSCIAGVGGDVKPLVRTARSGRPIVALDGCPLQCAAKILARQGLAADKHYDLSKMGVKKSYHEDFDPGEAGRLLQEIRADIASTIGALCQPPQSASSGGTSCGPQSHGGCLSGEEGAAFEKAVREEGERK